MVKADDDDDDDVTLPAFSISSINKSDLQYEPVRLGEITFDTSLHSSEGSTVTESDDEEEHELTLPTFLKIIT